MENVEDKHAPIRQSVRVDCPIEEAFELFTEHLAEWWPLASHSVSGEDAETCGIEPWAGGRVFERTRSGEEREWGSVIAWDPPTHLEFTWHPGAGDDRNQTVAVEFRVEAGGTRVTLTHSGWHLAGVPSCSLQQSGTARWPANLETCFREFVSAQLAIAV